MKMRIGKRLQQLRALYNVTLEDLAESTGIPLSTLNRIEQGTCKGITRINGRTEQSCLECGQDRGEVVAH